MPERMVESSPGEIHNTRFDEIPTGGEASAQSRSRPATELIWASRPRTYDLDPETIRAEIGQGRGEHSDYHFTATSGHVDSQGVPTATSFHIGPNCHGGTPDRDVPPHEFTQTGLKFKGDVRDTEFKMTQVAFSMQYTSECHQPGEGEQNHQSMHQEKPLTGYVVQSGVSFSNSADATTAELNQSVRAEVLYPMYKVHKTNQGGMEVEGETTKCKFPVVSQRLW